MTVGRRAVVVTLVAYAAISALILPSWSTDQAIWFRASRISLADPRARINYAVAIHDQAAAEGEFQAARRGALAHHDLTRVNDHLLSIADQDLAGWLVARGRTTSAPDLDELAALWNEAFLMWPDSFQRLPEGGFRAVISGESVR